MIEVTMPRLGETVEDATISNWLKNVGDRVEVGESIVEVSTDKVDTEVDSTAAGWISELRAAIEDVVPVGAVIAVISETEPNA